MGQYHGFGKICGSLIVEQEWKLQQQPARSPMDVKELSCSPWKIEFKK